MLLICNVCDLKRRESLESQSQWLPGKSLRGLPWTKKRRDHSQEKWDLSLGLSGLPLWRIGKTKWLLGGGNPKTILENE